MTAPPPHGAPAPVGQAVVRGSMWLIATGMMSRALGVVGTLLLTHFIAPEVYGAVADAVIVTFTISLIANVGIGVYVIAHPEAGPEELFHATVIHVGLAVLFLIPLAIFGKPLGVLFGAPDMHVYLPGLMVVVMCERLNMLPERLLIRRMRFGVISIQRAGAEVLYTLVSVLGAAFGMGGMAIVAGNVVRSAVRVPFLLWLVSWREFLRPTRLRREILARIVRFGLPISLGQLVGFGIRRWDNLVVSHLHGVGAAGAYNLAYNLADIPAVQVGEQITDALQVSFARGTEGDPLRRLLASLGMLAFIMTPMAVGLGLIAPTLAGVFLGGRWEQVGPMLTWLAVISFPRPLSGAVVSYLQVQGRQRVYLAIELFTLGMLLASLFTLGRLDPIAACIAVGGTFVVRLLAVGFVLWKLDGVKLRDFFAPQLPPVAASLVMAGAVVVVRIALVRVGAPEALSLGLQIVVGVISYGLGAWLFARETSRQFLSIVRRALG